MFSLSSTYKSISLHIGVPSCLQFLKKKQNTSAHSEVVAMPAVEAATTNQGFEQETNNSNSNNNTELHAGRADSW